MAEVKLTDITKVYDDAQGTETAVDDISLTVEDGERLVLVGPSGCGKTTTLRMIAGLETVTDGAIEIGDEEVQHLAPSERSIAMVFQNYALYQKMTARENIAYGLKHSTSMPETERQERVAEMADMLSIEDILDDRPSQMSGGQQQRVALGRALVRDPDVFLLDEPLSNLDAKLRSTMRTELQRIQDQLGVTMIYVTHNQKEAMTMGDKIAIMNDGRIQQFAPPERAYDRPENEFVATFLGSPSMNVVDADAHVRDDELVLTVDGQEFVSLPAAHAPNLSSPDIVRVGIRPEDLSLDTGSRQHSEFLGTVTVNEYQGNTNYVYIEFAETEITAKTRSTVDPRHGETVQVSVAPESVYLFEPDTGDALKTRTETGRRDIPPRE